MVFFLFMGFLIAQRLTELFVAKRNAVWLLKNGAIEYGREHYPYIVMLHTCFIISLILEYAYKANGEVNYFLMVLFFVLIVIKFFVIATLGNYWNTRIYKVPGSKPVATGIYKHVKHPNYIIVICEIAIIPLIFDLYYTAIIFTILNAIMLTIRIRKENEVLAM